jgi:hypothetical protein
VNHPNGMIPLRGQSGKRFQREFVRRDMMRKNSKTISKVVPGFLEVDITQIKIGVVKMIRDKSGSFPIHNLHISTSNH